MKKFALYLFVAVSVGEVVSILTSMNTLSLICKPMLMITLGWFYLLSIEKEDRSASVILAVALSFAGDVFLMLQHLSDSYFMMGLIAFLAAHIFYVMAYRQHRNEETTNALQGVQRVRFAFPIILAGTGLVVILYPVLGDLKFPVMIYAAVLILMVLNALFRYGRTNTTSFWMVFGGAVLFLISDSVLAINKFLQPIQDGVLIVMLTYIIGQFFIVSGLIQHFRKV